MTTDRARYFSRFELASIERKDEPFLTVHSSDSQTPRAYSFSEFWRGCREYAERFQALGAVAGDKVLIFSGTDPRVYFAFFGAQFLGLTPAIMPPPTVKQDLAYYRSSHEELIERIAPNIVLGVNAALNVLRLESFGLALAPSGDADLPLWARRRGASSVTRSGDLCERDIALLQHSSGTTGLKKGVMLPYRAILAQVDHYAAALDLSSADRIVSWLPLYHDMGLIACTVLPFVTATPIVVIDPFTWLSQPLSLMRMIETHRGTLVWLPNFAFEYLANAGRRLGETDLSSLRIVTNCSEVCRVASMDRFAAAFAKSGLRPTALHASYALAENVFAATQSLAGQGPSRLRVDSSGLREGRVVTADSGATGVTVLVSSGAPIAGCELSIKTDDELTFDDGRIGEIVIRSDCLFEGYYLNDALTRERLIDGRYHTRDHGFLWKGEVYVLGRIDDVIIYRGRNLFAPDLESSLLDLPGLKPGRLIVFGIFDERLGSEQVAVLYEASDAGEVGGEPLETLIRGRLQDRFGVNPLFVERRAPNMLAKTTSGKLSRKQNKDRFLAELQQESTQHD